MRKSYLDNIRWSVVIVVVVYHVFYMYNAEGLLGVAGPVTNQRVQYQDLFLYIVYPWIMAVLFIVSGICARYSLGRRTPKEFLRDRTTRLLVPSTVGLFAFQFLQGYVNMALGGAFETMAGVPAVGKYFIMAVSGIGPLWYIQLLWLFSVLLLLVCKVDKDRLWNACRSTTAPVLVLLAVPVWAAAQVLNTPIIVVYRFGFYGFLFLLGYFVFSHDEVIDRVKAWFPLFAAAAVALGAAFCVRYFGENYADVPVNRTPLFLGYSWFACLAILGGMARFGDRSTSATRWLGAHSFGLYMLHYLGISAVALFLAKPGLLPVWAIYPVTLLAGFAAGYLLYAIISRVPYYRWAVLGLPAKKVKPAKEAPHVSGQSGPASKAE